MQRCPLPDSWAATHEAAGSSVKGVRRQSLQNIATGVPHCLPPDAIPSYNVAHR
jgi:hypothetical protein